MGIEVSIWQQVEFVSADLLKDDEMSKAVEGATYVIHTATLVSIEEPKDENTVIGPAIEGCLSVLKAAKKFGVKRVVITSSIAAVCGIPDDLKPDVFDERHWSDPEWEGLKSAYEKGKTISELKSWQFINSIPEGEHKPELVTICPGFISGPFISAGSSNTTSINMIKKFMLNELPGIPHISFPTVDVRDVALAHLRAMER
jgi:dihydroflavonol-4-reductase